ncbi:MBL fold metallo-hydrolase [Acuticoccus kandeliae]|uniref:MBL fold metallo-hydrolase n=1 Tax=Acuticoccus kandeliae TaxID=2073160 RepID=UPI000D3E8761|nr:MBL fold metallo-hydrolase [Acuticoccus kandeliae]
MVEHDDDTLSLTLWGVRGSIPAPGRNTVRYGGETACFEVRAGPHTLVIDCGSGVRACGRALARRGLEQIDVIFTHTHMDHICGLPFFCLAYDPAVEVNLWGGHIPPGGTLEEIVERLMSPPIFPVATSALNNTRFRRFKGGNPITLGSGLTVASTRLNHPGNCCGYRIDWRGSSIAIITDHEHGNPKMDAAVAEFVTGADVMIYDAMYLDTEYPRFVGWGHSTPTQALALAARSGVTTPVIFHHDPDRTDDALDALGADLVRQMPTAEVAREGQTISLRGGERIRESVKGIVTPA